MEILPKKFFKNIFLKNCIRMTFFLLRNIHEKQLFLNFTITKRRTKQKLDMAKISSKAP